MNSARVFSPFDHLAEVAGQTLLHSLWQGAAIAFLAAALLAVIDRRRAHLRYLTCCLASFSLALWVALTFLDLWQEPHSGSFTSPPAPATNPSGFMTESLMASPSETASATLLRPRPKPWTYFAALSWAAGAAFFVARLVFQWRALRRLRLTAIPVADPETGKLFARVCDRLKIREKVALRISDRIDGPIMAGFLWPVVILPAALLGGIPAPYLQSIFAHELAHFRRWDYPLNLLQSFIAAVLFYHPAAWWISRQIRIEREHACDDVAVALSKNGPSQYARALNWLEERRAGADTRKLSLAISRDSQDTVGRLRRLVSIWGRNPSQSRVNSIPNPVGLGWILLAAILGLSVLGLSKVTSSATRLVEYIEPVEAETATAGESIARIDDGYRRTELAERLLEGDPWTDRTIRNRQISLFKSGIILEKNGKLYNLLDDDPPFFPELPNRYLLDNKLNFLDGNLPDRDPDGDHFTVLEEFHAETDPNDPNDHPDYLTRLSFVKRHARIYRIVFAAQPDETRFQLNRLPSVKWERKTMIHRIGEATTDGQLRLDRLTEEGLEATFLETRERFLLPKKRPIEIPTWFAEMKLDLAGENPFFVKLDETFRLRKEPGRVLRLSRVEETGAEIVDETSGVTRTLGTLGSRVD